MNTPVSRSQFRGNKTQSRASSAVLEAERLLLLREGRKIVEALGKMFAPSCEVVLHDLTDPSSSIVAIECPLSGRKIGDSVTEIGIARVEDRDFPDVVQNYSNQFSDGRQVKSTSIGLRNSAGDCIGAICLNLDISLFSQVHRVMEQLILFAPPPPVLENLQHRSVEGIRTLIDSYAASKNKAPQTLSKPQRIEIIHQLQKSGLLQLRHATSTAAEILGISRASVYQALKA